MTSDERWEEALMDDDGYRRACDWCGDDLRIEEALAGEYLCYECREILGEDT